MTILLDSLIHFLFPGGGEALHSADPVLRHFLTTFSPDFPGERCGPQSAQLTNRRKSWFPGRTVRPLSDLRKIGENDIFYSDNLPNRCRLCGTFQKNKSGPAIRGWRNKG